jgi:hypothetical protein
MSIKMVVREMGSGIMQVQLNCLKFCKIFGSSSMHNFISKNLVGSTLNTTRSNFCKENFIYFISISKSMFHYMCSVMKKCKKQLGLSMWIPFECGKDEMKSLNLPHGIGGWTFATSSVTCRLKTNGN